MIERDLLSRPVVRAGVAALAIATMVVAWTTVRALRPGSGDVIAPRLFDGSTAIAPVPPRIPADLGLAVENDLFAADRSEPALPYRLPDEEDEAADAGPVSAPVIPVVLGTASMGDGRGFATCQLGDAQPVIVHVGDKLGEYTVKSIERGRVVFTTPTRRLEIPALKTGT